MAAFIPGASPPLVNTAMRAMIIAYHADAVYRASQLAQIARMPVHIVRQTPIATVIIDRPEARNAVDRDTAAALADAFRALEADPDIRAAVLCGAGGTFCAGADLKAIAEGRPNRIEPDGDGPMGPSRMLLDIPVIAAVEGHAVAGGLELALWCDLRVADPNAVFGVYCRRFGVPLIDGGTVRLPRIVGLGRALDMILTGRPVATDEAVAMGLVNRVAPGGQARQVAEDLARQLTAFPQAAMLGDRRSAYEQFGMDLPAALQNELTRGMPALREANAGAARFAGGAGRGGSFTDDQ